MTIFDQALKMEKEGETIYRQFGKESSDEGRKTIFTWPYWASRAARGARLELISSTRILLIPSVGSFILISPFFEYVEYNATSFFTISLSD